MKKFFILIITLVFILVLNTTAWGAFFGARAVGMGGTFTAVADDSSAVYRNPAGITQLKGLTFTPGLGVLGTGGQIQSYLNLLEDQNLDKFAELFQNQNSDELNSGASTYFGIATKTYGINAFFDANIITKQESNLNKNYTESNRYVIGTMAIPLGHLVIGGNIKLVQGSYVESVIPVIGAYNYQYILDNWATIGPLITDPNLNYSTSATGSGLVFDVGLLFGSKQLKVGIAGRNVTGIGNWEGSTTKYSYNLDPITPMNSRFVAGTPESFTSKMPLPATYSVGIAWRPSRSTLMAADLETIINPVDGALNQFNHHLGLEQTISKKSITLRAGVFSRNDEKIGLSGGVGFKAGSILIDIAVLTVNSNIGIYATTGFKF